MACHYSCSGTVSIMDLSYDRSSLTFTCTTTGGPATTVTWSRDGTPLVGGTYQQSQTLTDTASATYLNTLSITAKDNGLSGAYTCTVQNANSMDSESISVTGALMCALYHPICIIIINFTFQCAHCMGFYRPMKAGS